jgi:hypothetical protein
MIKLSSPCSHTPCSRTCHTDSARIIADLRRANRELLTEKGALTTRTQEYTARFTHLQEECRQLVAQHEELYTTLTDYERQYELIRSTSQREDFDVRPTPREGEEADVDGGQGQGSNSSKQHPLRFSGYYTHVLQLYTAARHTLSHQQQRWSETQQHNQELQTFTTTQQASLDDLALRLRGLEGQAAREQQEVTQVRALLQEREHETLALKEQKEVLAHKLQRIVVGYSTLLGH